METKSPNSTTPKAKPEEQAEEENKSCIWKTFDGGQQTTLASLIINDDVFDESDYFMNTAEQCNYFTQKKNSVLITLP